ncbi:hypothetical protein Leryth_020262 [Lithospermum erythrorhizon]|nr:hypothetical protein Leryth_020262 [Lithospermum erythrorhizon]
MGFLYLPRRHWRFQLTEDHPSRSKVTIGIYENKPDKNDALLESCKVGLQFAPSDWSEDLTNYGKVDVQANFPHYLKLCFLVIHNGINEVAYDALKEYGIDTPIPKESAGRFMQGLSQEAKWYFSDINQH